MRDISLHLMDIVQNSIVAGASMIEIRYEESTANHTVAIEIVDNGKGMAEEQLAQVVNPFFTTRTTRDIGLGVPLFQMSAEATGGSFAISSELGKGTKLRAFFHTDHIDMHPLGDTAGTIQLLITGNPEIDFSFVYQVDERAFRLSTTEMREILGDVPFSDPEITLWLGEFLEEGLGELQLDTSPLFDQGV